MKRALITGIGGQDASYLTEFLLNKDYTVFGTIRSCETKERIKDIEDKIEILEADLRNENVWIDILKQSSPDEFYNLASQSDVGLSFKKSILTGDVTGLGVTRILEAIRKYNRAIKFYQASSSEMFGKVLESPQNEKTPFNPRSPYGAAKVYGHHMTRIYRAAYGIFACNGILFNHESPRRGIEFVTRKITYTLAKIKKGQAKELVLGNIDSERDWGHAKDYVRAKWLMLQQDKPDDYVIGTGKKRRVRDFLEIAAKYAGLDIHSNGKKGIDEKFLDEIGKVIVRINPMYYRPADVNTLWADSSKAKEKLGWAPKISFEQLVREMVEYDLREQ